MRIALLGPYPPDEQVTGGVDAVMVALVRGMTRRPGLDLHVVTAVPGLRTAVTETRPTADPTARLTLHRVPHPRGERLLWHLPAVRLLRHTVDEIAPDVVHAQMPGLYAGAARAAGRPYVVSLHGVVFREATLAARDGVSPGMCARWLVDSWYERWIVGQARDLISTTPYTREEFRGRTSARFHDIENPVDEVFFGVPAETATDPRLLCVAQLIPRKDIMTLLHVFARVREALSGTERAGTLRAQENTLPVLEIVGQKDADPAYAAACQQEIERLGLQDAVFLSGSLPAHQLADACSRASLVLLTSLQETAPVAIAVAMAAGRAVVATRVGGVPFMVADGRTGFLAAPGDVEGISGAVLELLRDPPRRRAFGEAAREAARARYHVDAVVDRTLALYGQLCGRHAQSIPAAHGQAAAQ